MHRSRAVNGTTITYGISRMRPCGRDPKQYHPLQGPPIGDEPAMGQLVVCKKGWRARPCFRAQASAGERRSLPLYYQ